MSHALSDLRSKSVSRRQAMQAVVSDLELHLSAADGGLNADGFVYGVDKEVIANALRHAREHAKALREALAE
jgi:hypothetical protein